MHQAKTAAIAEMQTLANTEVGCFREGINSALGNVERRRRTLVMRVLQWVFAERSHQARIADCCDVCAGCGSTDIRRTWARDVIRRMATG